MSRFSLRIARLFGRKLPCFASRAEAETALFARRDHALAALEAAAGSGGAFSADYSPASLKALEAWYFKLWEQHGFAGIGTTREEFERWMAWYYGATAVRNNPASKWVVEEFPFDPGRYELGVRAGLGTEMLTAGFVDHYVSANNVRRDRLYRRYRDQYT